MVTPQRGRNSNTKKFDDEIFNSCRLVRINCSKGPKPIHERKRGTTRLSKNRKGRERRHAPSLHHEAPRSRCETQNCSPHFDLRKRLKRTDNERWRERKRRAELSDLRDGILPVANVASSVGRGSPLGVEVIIMVWLRFHVQRPPIKQKLQSTRRRPRPKNGDFTSTRRPVTSACNRASRPHSTDPRPFKNPSRSSG